MTIRSAPSAGKRRLPGLRDVRTPEDLRTAVAVLGPEPRECPVCAAAAPARAFERNGKWFWSCRACSLVFVHDLYPEFVEAFDEADYSGIVRRRELSGRQRRRIERVLASFEAERRTNRLLEVGCGDGVFLEAARAAGWEVRGVELLADVARVARDERGLDVAVGELPDAGLDADLFDVVYMNEVIEHVVDPVELLAEVRRVLRPGGLACLRTGNAESWAARLRGGRWWYYEFNGHGHIRFFGPTSARALAAAAGFAGGRADTHGFAFLEDEETRGRWYRLPLKLLQAPLSLPARLLGRGQRLTMRLRERA